jgi:hypothetical protein
MKSRLPCWIGVVALCVLGTAACSDDDGAEVRSSGSVEIVGPTPPAGGGSVSATGTGCNTKGGTTRIPSQMLTVELDEYTVKAPSAAKAGVTEVVVRNVGSQTHEIGIAKAATRDALPIKDGRVDEAALEATGLFKIESFAKNTICRGVFDLTAGTYVFFDNLGGTASTPGNFQRGMAVVVTVS